ncbi:PxKF domain-containing protein [Sinomonas flava]|uniref:PxKF domain-containing protein n=1 Tax=Sinomonas flava TaxID=496857 RepID=UPI0039A4A29D
MTRSRHLSRPALASAATAALALGLAVQAHADTLLADGDALTEGTDVALGTIACDQTIPFSTLLSAVREGAPGTASVYADGSTVSFDASVLSWPAGMTVDFPTAWPELTLPSDWTARPDGTRSDSAEFQMALRSTANGPGETTIRWWAGGTSATPGEAPVVLNAETRVTWETTGCRDADTAPTAPGTPSVSARVTGGSLTLSWAPSTDAEGDPLTYSVETRDRDDLEWKTVITGLTSTTLTLAAPEEGTRSYRVTAVEAGTTAPALSSAPSAPSATVVVDRGAPNAPSYTTSRGPEYTAPDGTGWWRDSVGVAFASAGDPALPDGSAGSGVTSVTGSATVATAGPFRLTGVARDAALNKNHTVVSGAVDGAAPTVALDCPAEAVVGSAASGTWTASDEAGGSGVAGASSGSLGLATDAVGARTATLTAGAASDRVGHATSSASCSYRVVYPFAGFFRSVDTDRVNVARAGRDVALSFSLGGDRGLGVLDGAPTFAVTGGALAGEPIDQSGKLPGAGLTYDAASGQYTYLWKTDRLWAGKSGTVSVRLADGTVHSAVFSFTK